MRALLAFAVFIAVVAVGLSREIASLTSKPGDRAALVLSGSAATPRAQSSTHGPRMITLRSDRRGHFQVNARIDGRRIGLVVDTGASRIVLRESAAARLGIVPRPSEYVGRARTANGIARFAPVRLNTVEVDGIVVRDVEAAVMHDDALAENLLGMTFLSRVKWTHDRGRLILEQ